MKPSTSSRLHILIPICWINSVLMGMLWSSLDWFFPCSTEIFPCFWCWLHFVINFLTLPLILHQKNIFEIYFMVESLSQCKSIALAFKSCPNPLWTSLIMVCCHSVEETTSLVLLHINCSWSIEKVYQQVFRNLAFLPYLPLYTMHRCFYVSTFQLVQN